MSDLMIPLPSELIDALVERLAARLETYPHWLEIEALAVHYRVPVSRVRFWRSLGLPARRIGKRLIFSIDDADEWLSTAGVAA